MLLFSQLFYWQTATATSIVHKIDSIPQKLIAAALHPIDDDRPLPMPVFKNQSAILTGHLTGYAFENQKAHLVYNNPITNEEINIDLTIDSKGSFKVIIPLVSASEVMLYDFLPYNGKIILEPGKESVLWADLRRPNKKEQIVFSGAFADINNQFYQFNLSNYSRRFLSPSLIYGLIDNHNTSAETLKKFILQQVSKGLKDLSEDKQLLTKTRQLAEINLRMDAASWIVQLDMVYRDERKRNKKITIPDFDERFFSALKEFHVNDYYGLYSSDFAKVINNAAGIEDIIHHNVVKVNFISNENFASLLKDYPLSKQERAYIAFLKTENPNNWPAERKQKQKVQTIKLLKRIKQIDSLPSDIARMIKDLDAAINLPNANAKQINNMQWALGIALAEASIFIPDDSERQYIEEPKTPFDAMFVSNFNDRFADESRSFANKEYSDSLKRVLTHILGTSSGIMFDLSTSQLFCKKLIRQNTPLNAYDIAALQSLKDSFLQHYILSISKQILEKTPENQLTNNYRIYSIDKTIANPDIVLNEIIKPFNGKTIYIDFWATWCAPCIQAIKDFKQTKASINKDNVIFIYLTDESSPTKIWKNMINEMSGEHIRITHEQMSALKSKLKISGIPAYLIFDKIGNQVYLHTGFEGIDKTAEVLKKALN